MTLKILKSASHILNDATCKCQRTYELVIMKT